MFCKNQATACLHGNVLVNFDDEREPPVQTEKPDGSVGLPYRSVVIRHKLLRQLQDIAKGSVKPTPLRAYTDDDPVA